MPLRIRSFWFLAVCAVFLSVLGMLPVQASGPSAPRFANAYELIDAVNRLRAQNGLPGYSINSILMNVAQAHSDYQAAIGSVTHYGPNGNRPYQRALAAGYSVAGDLSLGGFYSENIMGGPGLTAQSVVNAWTADAPHTNTMLSGNLTEVGAGVSCSGDYCYFTLDAAQPSGAPIVYTPPAGGGASVSVGDGSSETVPTRVVVFPNTPKSDGSISHIVQPGETLWSIALAYKTNVDSLKSLNRLSTNDIYPGDTLVIFQSRATQTAAPTETGTPVPTATPFVFRTATSLPEPTATPIPSAPLTGGSGALVVGIIVVAALVAAGVMTAVGARSTRYARKSDK
jgi:LysM repeat protein